MVSCAVVAFLLALARPASARDFVTTNGTEYKDAKVDKVHPTGIDITYAKGIAFLEFEELPESVRKEFGYDPEKAREAAKKAEKKIEAARKEGAEAAEKEKLAEDAAKSAAEKKKKAAEEKEVETKVWLAQCAKTGTLYVFVGKVIFQDKNRPLMAFTKGLKEGDTVVGDATYFHHKGERYLVAEKPDSLVPVADHIKSFEKIIADCQEQMEKIDEDVNEKKKIIDKNEARIKSLDAQLYHDPKTYSGNSDIIARLQKENKKLEKEIQKFKRDREAKAKAAIAARTSLNHYKKESEKFEAGRKG